MLIQTNAPAEADSMWNGDANVVKDTSRVITTTTTTTTIEVVPEEAMSSTAIQEETARPPVLESDVTTTTTTTSVIPTLPSTTLINNKRIRAAKVPFSETEIAIIWQGINENQPNQWFL